MKFIGVYNYTVILTYLSLVSAFVGMVFSGQGRFTLAILCLFLSGVCDAFDGMVARTKKDRSEDEKAFGIQIDSLCDAVSFGVFPAVLCYQMGMDDIMGVAVLAAYCLCGVSRLAFFNVMEAKRQKTESGANKTYRGLPITSSSLVLPAVYGLRFVIWDRAFVAVLCVIMMLMGFLFVLDISVKKPDWAGMLRMR